MYKKKIIYTNEKIFDKIQYFISILISILFAIGLFPFTYSKISTILIFLILIELFISILRLRVLNIIFELILIILSIISFIPLLGIIPRFIGIIFGIIEISTFKNKVIYEKVQIITLNNYKKYNNKYSNKNKKKIKTKEKITDVEFEEK